VGWAPLRGSTDFFQILNISRMGGAIFAKFLVFVGILERSLNLHPRSVGVQILMVAGGQVAKIQHFGGDVSGVSAIITDRFAEISRVM